MPQRRFDCLSSVWLRINFIKIIYYGLPKGVDQVTNMNHHNISSSKNLRCLFKVGYISDSPGIVNASGFTLL